jgi:pimeloyl-ACP methyl ester carboxylesterase
MNSHLHQAEACRSIEAGALRIAYQEWGPANGPPVVLLHGFPYGIAAYAAVCPRLVKAGCRVIVPWLRGFGETFFLRPDTPRSGQQSALAYDLLMLMDALAIPKAVLGGYDWGGRAACILAALQPERVRGLISGLGYAIQNIAVAAQAASPEEEHKLWYQYYLHGARGQVGLEAQRYAFCRLLWQMWSPSWQFDEATYARTASAFENPDFVAVVVHSYRHRHGLVAGDPALDEWEAALARGPRIHVPTIALDGLDDGVAAAGGSGGHAPMFSASFSRTLLPGIGHNLPQEAPAAFADAVLRLLAQT